MCPIMSPAGKLVIQKRYTLSKQIPDSVRSSGVTLPDYASLTRRQKTRRNMKCNVGVKYEFERETGTVIAPSYIWKLSMAH
jgi:hypothetical protein